MARKPSTATATANLGFEAKLWLAAMHCAIRRTSSKAAPCP